MLGYLDQNEFRRYLWIVKLETLNPTNEFIYPELILTNTSIEICIPAQFWLNLRSNFFMESLPTAGRHEIEIEFCSLEINRVYR